MGYWAFCSPITPNYRQGAIRRAQSAPSRDSRPTSKETIPTYSLYDWPGDGSLSVVRDWVHTAFLRRGGTPPVQLLDAVQVQQRRIVNASFRRDDTG